MTDQHAEYVAPKDPINNTRCVCCGQDPCKRQSADDVRWQQVVCGDCGTAYQCTPMNDSYLPTGSTDGVRVCFVCLLARTHSDGSEEG